MADEKKEVGFKMLANAPVEQAIETAPNIYIDGAVGLAVADGMVRFNLYQDRGTLNPANPEASTTVTRVVCARLIMTQTTAQQIARWLETAEGMGKPAKEETGG